MAQLLSSLPIGAKVKFGRHSVNGETPQDIIWLVVAKNHTGYVNNSVTLLAEKIIDLRILDAKEYGLPDTINGGPMGNNNYGLSNLDLWLNSSNTTWYSATHSNDTPPNYTDRPGFLSNFTPNEIDAIIQNRIVVTKYLSTTETLTRRVYLPSLAELGLTKQNELVDGYVWEYFSLSSTSRSAKITEQCYKNTREGYKPTSNESYWFYWVRSAYSTYSRETYNIGIGGDVSNTPPDTSPYGVRPAITLTSDSRMSDTTDNDGCYTVIWNSAPTTPSNLVVPNIFGGKSNAISWSSATDAEGDNITYQLECSIDGGNYEQIYSGASTMYAHLVPFGTGTVTYRVKATDPLGESSAYKTSSTITVINNNAPVISGTDANLGIKRSGFTGTYTITDADRNSILVTEAIDGIPIRTLSPTLGEVVTYEITGDTWLSLANGSHTLTITAVDGVDSTTRTYAFGKLVEFFTIQNSTPWASSTMPSRIMLVVTRNIPTTAQFKVEVCNNGYDVIPTWEDCTDAVKSGLIHVFSNQTKTAGSWGVLFRPRKEKRNGQASLSLVDM